MARLLFSRIIGSTFMKWNLQVWLWHVILLPSGLFLSLSCNWQFSVVLSITVKYTDNTKRYTCIIFLYLTFIVLTICWTTVWWLVHCQLQRMHMSWVEVEAIRELYEKFYWNCKYIYWCACNYRRVYSTVVGEEFLNLKPQERQKIILTYLECFTVIIAIR